MARELQSDRWFSVEEIAEHLGISKETVYRWIDRAKIPAHRVGKFWKFQPSEVDAWIRNGGAADTQSDLYSKKHQENQK
jgi:excisionase family DNA binding protein